jgi:serine/threonine-protein kinase HipA
MALKFDGRDDNLKAAYFIAFGARFGVSESATRSLPEELYETSEKWIGRLAEIGLSERSFKDLESVMKKRRGDLCP